MSDEEDLDNINQGDGKNFKVSPESTSSSRSLEKAHLQ
jgi:hypothetical protein